MRHSERRNPKAFAGLGMVLWGLLQAVPAQALPPEHEMRRLTQAADQAVAEGRWDMAADYLIRLDALNVEPEPEYYYLRGMVMYHAGQVAEARAAFEAFVVRTEPSTPRYRDALNMITQVEALQARQAQQPEPVARIEAASSVGSAPGESGMARSLNVLLEDVNTRLAHLAYWEGRVVRGDQAPTLRYQLALGKAGELIWREQRGGSTSLTSSQSMRVFGVRPQVRFDCAADADACWVYDPRDDARWFKLAPRPAEVAQLATALGQLIRQAQRP